MVGEHPTIDSILVNEFVSVAHGDINRVKELLQQEPGLVNCARDWGAGDWETGLGAAAHMGRADIANFLLENGARLDIFAATMLGNLDIVRAAVQAYPGIVDIEGPHGIPLIAHAIAGGQAAAHVADFLESCIKG